MSDAGVSVILPVWNVAGFVGEALASVRRQDGPIRELFANVARLAERVGPSGAVRLMKLADEPADVAKMAAMVERAGSAGKGIDVFGPDRPRKTRGGDVSAAERNRQAADRPARKASHRAHRA